MNMMEIRIKSIVVVGLFVISIFAGIDLGSEGTAGGTSPFLNSPSDWGPSLVISEPVFGSNINNMLSAMCKIVVEGDQSYVIWEDLTNLDSSGTDSDIFFRHFNGTSWEDIQVISEPVPGQNINTAWSGSADIAVENGKIYVVWEDLNNTDGAGSSDTDIFYRTNLTGNGWEDIQVISEPVFGNDYNVEHSSAPEIEVENGKVYVAWHDQNDTNGAGNTNVDIFYRTNLTGAGWEPVVVISEPTFTSDTNDGQSYDIDLEVYNGAVYAVWQDTYNLAASGGDADILYRYKPPSGAWQNLEVISEPTPGSNNNDAVSLYPSIAVENGNIYVAWEDMTDYNGAGAGETDIFYRTNLTGTGWEDIQVISEEIEGQDNTNANSAYAEIEVENGDVYIVWESLNTSVTSGLDSDIFYRTNTTGTGWDDIQIISEPVAGADLNTGESKVPDIAVLSGKSHVVWFDDNNTDGAMGDADIFYRGMFVAPSLIQATVTPKYGNTSTVFNFTVDYIDGDNEPPVFMNITLNGMNHTMMEGNTSDTNMVDGKTYYYTTILGIANDHNFRIWASDGTFTTSTALIDAPDVNNTKPKILTGDVLNATEDIPYEVHYDYTDIDELNVGQILSWNFDTNATWLTFNYTSTNLSGTPENDDVGLWWVNVSISDTLAVDFHNFTVNVSSVNDAPKIITDNVVNATQDEYYEVDYEAEDPDSIPQQLRWSMSTDAAWLSFSMLTGVLHGTPTNSEVGTYFVNITVNDSQLSDFTNFTLNVLNINDPPIISGNDSTFAKVGEKYSASYTATDIDPTDDVLSWKMATNTGNWLSFDAANAALSGTPAESDMGIFWVNVSVHDGNGGFDFHNFSLTVAFTPPAKNLNPNITTEDVTNAVVNKEYRVDYDATDDRTPVPDLVWSWNTNASFLAFAQATGVLSGTPKVSDLGSYWVYIAVSDGEGGLAERNFTLYVTMKPIIPPGTDENHPPVLTEGKITPASGDTETDFTFSVKYNDEDGDAPSSINVVIDGKQYPMTLKEGNDTANGTYVFTMKLTEGTHNYYFWASDGTDRAIAGDNTPITAANAATTPEIKDADEKKQDGGGGAAIWVIVIIVIIIVVILIFMFMGGKKEEEKPPAEEERVAADAAGETAVAEAATGEGESEGVAELIDEAEGEEAVPAAVAAAEPVEEGEPEEADKALAEEAEAEAEEKEPEPEAEDTGTEEAEAMAEEEPPSEEEAEAADEALAEEAESEAEAVDETVEEKAEEDETDAADREVAEEKAPTEAEAEAADMAVAAEAEKVEEAGEADTATAAGTEEVVDEKKSIEEDGPVNCPDCGKQCKNAVGLKIHSRKCPGKSKS